MRPPNNVVIELTHGCNKRCSFCGLQGVDVPPGTYNYMPRSVALRLAGELDQFGGGGYLTFALRGEPTMHPEVAQMLAIFRSVLPRRHMVLTTNGINFIKNGKLLADILRFVNIVVVDTYEPERQKVIDAVKAACALYGLRYFDYYDKDVPSPYKKQTKIRNTAILMDDIGKRDGERITRQLHNWNGHTPEGRGFINSKRKVCTMPFRRMAVGWNGDVLLCCVDIAGDFVAGNIMQRPVEDIWTGGAMQAARSFLYHGLRVFSPCLRCDYNIVFYKHLLAPQPPPDDGTAKIVKDVLDNHPTHSLWHDKMMLPRLSWPKRELQKKGREGHDFNDTQFAPYRDEVGE